MHLQRYADRIQAEHDRLRHRRGWRFLESPAATLSPYSRLAFIGLNPSGRNYEPPQVSVEAGNAYRVERWGPGGQPDALQAQVRRMYEALAREAGSLTASELMDETLAGNFCPFRSPLWAQLERRRESIDFSLGLWADVLDVARPRAVICLGESARLMREVLTIQGAEQVAGAGHRTGSRWATSPSRSPDTRRSPTRPCWSASPTSSASRSSARRRRERPWRPSRRPWCPRSIAHRPALMAA